MSEQPTYVPDSSSQPDDTLPATRAEASGAVTGLGWRLTAGLLRTCVRAGALARAAEVAGRLAAAAGPAADGSLLVDIRPGRLVLTVQSPRASSVTAAELDLAARISAAAADLGLVTDAGIGAADIRPVQVVELAIDAMDIPAVRPFWREILGYADEVGETGPPNAIADPIGQGPSIWFQQMTEPRTDRNRIHLDIIVPHDEAAGRMAAAIAAGGRLVSDDEAPAFWVLADPEGNEACICTWQGRDA